MPSVFALRWRVSLMVLGGAGLFAPAAQASSFVTVAPPETEVSSSFVVLGEEPPQAVEQAAVEPTPKPRSAMDAPPDYAWEPPPRQISASIIAFGTPEIEETQVASISPPEPRPDAKPAAPPEAAQPQVVASQAADPPPRPRARPAPLPRVIRAGVKGHAFPDYVAPQPPVAENADAPQPAVLAQPPSPDQAPGQAPGQPPPAAPGGDQPAAAPPPAPRGPDRSSLR